MSEANKIEELVRENEALKRRVAELESSRPSSGEPTMPEAWAWEDEATLADDQGTTLTLADAETLQVDLDYEADCPTIAIPLACIELLTGRRIAAAEHPRDESKPPPGWTVHRQAFGGVQHGLLAIRRSQVERPREDESGLLRALWTIYDVEHAPASADRPAEDGADALRGVCRDIDDLRIMLNGESEPTPEELDEELRRLTLKTYKRIDSLVAELPAEEDNTRRKTLAYEDP
jgi:hypothetical protein